MKRRSLYYSLPQLLVAFSSPVFSCFAATRSRKQQHHQQPSYSLMKPSHAVRRPSLPSSFCVFGSTFPSLCSTLRFLLLLLGVL